MPRSPSSSAAAAAPTAPTEEQILAAATRLFAARGVEATSLQDVADAVGIRKQSLLYHFAGKEALRRSVLEALLTRWNHVLPRLLLAATGEGQFDAVVSETIGFFAADPDRARLLLREVLDRPDEVRALLHTHIAPWVAVVCGYIRKGVARGAIAPGVDPEPYVLSVINLILSSIATGDCFGRMADRRRQLAEILRIAKASLFLPGETS
jgi:AcrR family transcriptional regulator